MATPDAIPQTIFHTDVFPAEGFGQGISHRAEQMSELLGRLGVPVVRVEARPERVPKARGMAWGLRHVWAWGHRSPARLKYVGRYGRRLASFVRAFREVPSAAGVVWGVTGDWTVPLAARICRLPIIATPTTFESLLPFDYDSMGGGSAWRKLRFELDLLGLAGSVWYASREEQWIAAGFGLRGGDHLPMYPAPALRDHLLRVRAARRVPDPPYALVLSSHTNPPNREGVHTLAAMLAGRSPVRVVLAGYGTERFAGEVPAGAFAIEGAVTQERLDALLAGARALVVHQHFGTGGLTRIPEALVAGVPVVGNGIAARSAHHYSGVHVYETADELAGLLAADLPTPPVPPPPAAAEERLLAAVRRVMGLGDRRSPPAPREQP